MSKMIDEKLPLDPDSKTAAMKTATYALMHLVVAMAVAYALSGSWKVALGIGLIEPAVQTLAYMVHERVWKRRLNRQRGSESAEEGRGDPLYGGVSAIVRPAGAIRPAAGC
ncbi:MAG: DUF2061 domain-containing protein [Marivibrio sp.]|uniref:DUF2061 domain-containing protein n=1 Tax=Marivibrio sp. TaxID=2039719 RepID=UPI0032EEC36B